MLDIDDSDDDILLNHLSFNSDSKSKSKNKTRRKSQSPKRASPSPKRGGVRRGKRLSKKAPSLSPERNKGTSSQEDIPPAIQAKLAIISDPATPMRERIKLELEMKRNPEEEMYFTEFKNSFDRKKYLAFVAKREKEEEERLQSNLKKEEARALREKEERAKARAAEIEKEIAKLEREDKMREELALHCHQVIAKDSEEVRKNAEKMLIRVTERGAEAELEEMERQAKKEEMHNSMDLSHVEKVLIEAIIDQKDTVN